jgi:DNA-binding NtrC family response regulator
MSSSVLIVDPDEPYRQRLSEVAATTGWAVTTSGGFHEARRAIAAAEYPLIVTSIKLGAFNGIHLIYLAKRANPHAICVAYSSHDDAGLGLDAQQAGAFYERSLFLPFSLTGYISSALPDIDRRDVRYVDRRTAFRGGRRASDRNELHQILPPSQN